MKWLLAALVAFTLGCERPEDDAASPPSPSATTPEESGLAPREEPSPTPSVEDSSRATPEGPSDLSEPGVYRDGGSFSLAVKTGMNRDQVSVLLDDALADGAVQINLSQQTKKGLGEQEVEVFVQEIAPVKRSEIETMRLTFFGERLVSILLIYGEASQSRALSWGERYGQGVHADGWMGWWLRDMELIVQGAPDGSVFELFDLAAARPAVPEIDLHMLQSWRRRYKVPPPWGAALVEERRQHEGPPSDSH